LVEVGVDVISLLLAWTLGELADELLLVIDEANEAYETAAGVKGFFIPDMATEA